MIELLNSILGKNHYLIINDENEFIFGRRLTLNELFKEHYGDLIKDLVQGIGVAGANLIK